MEGMQAALDAGMTPAVKIWVNWMMIVFFASIIFIWKYWTARWALIAILITLPIGVLIFQQTQNIHLIGIAHIIAWLPLAVYIWKTTLSKTAKASAPDNPSLYHRAFFFWACLLFATIVISLLFDVRDIFLVLTGGK